MKRTFDEISDEEWENHSFKPSKILNSSSSKPPPSIESFAFTSRSAPIDLTDDGDEDYVPPPDDVGDLEDDDEDLEDDDVDVAATSGRRRRFVVDDDDDDDIDNDNDNDEDDLQEVVEVKSEGEEEEEEEMELLSDTDDDEDDDDEKLEKEEEDVVGRALQKCAKISAELRKELNGPSVTVADRYAESVSSSVRIVTQDHINSACGAENSDFQPLLKPYQLVGVNFLLLLKKKKIGGAILADEMGLGKTVQAITYLMLLNHLENDPGPHLVVCPASVLENWERELTKWCPTFSVLQFHGAGRAAYAKELSSLAKAGLPPPFNVLLVCYSLFERHSAQQKDDRKILKRWRWSCVLMDEAHALKDKNSYRWKNLMSVAKNAKQRLMLTGTPLQNDLHELWSLLEFMLPDLFVTEDVDLKKLLKADDYDLITRMKSILGPFILRRLKSDVMQQLVPKEQRVEFVYMEKEHEDAYNEAIQEYRAVSQARMPKSSDHNSNNVVQVLPRRQISNYFVQFRKIANHPLLVRRIYNDEDIVRYAKKLYPKGVFGHECKLDRVIDEMKGYSDFSIHRLLFNYGIEDAKGILPEEQVIKSAKCQALAKLLPSLKRDGHRVLIFSQWTSMLDILEWALDVIGVTYRRLDGSTQVTERQSIVDTFNNDTSISACLLSTRAGGQGLNLIGADTVIIHDMDFNPQIDRQAEDRCHRIGQTKPVTIYRLVTKGTVDEDVYEIAKRKLVLDAAILESGTVVVDNGDLMPEKTMGEILSAILLR
ncbi:protein CHROMATIN REMODELING 19 [Beta vulgaris subsp. vulgaris]|uniref:protein CHROMATIN REMODELING 19 n=1 Tax=Beta vulgaris subsp. vulgaris TaxID=3555 RepID=UPI00254758DF|nr:protein CHROMATIN REMODELING 19 [Beta vulgaris subsp. vulgaris]